MIVMNVWQIFIGIKGICLKPSTDLILILIQQLVASPVYKIYESILLETKAHKILSEVLSQFLDKIPYVATHCICGCSLHGHPLV